MHLHKHVVHKILTYMCPIVNLDLKSVLFYLILHAGCILYAVSTLHVYGMMHLDNIVYIEDIEIVTRDNGIGIHDLRKKLTVEKKDGSTSKFCIINKVMFLWSNGDSDIDFDIVNIGNSRILIDMKDIEVYIENGWNGKSPGPMQNPARDGDSHVASRAWFYPSAQFDKRVEWLNKQVEKNNVHGLLENMPAVPSSAIIIDVGETQKVKVFFPIDFYSCAYITIPYTVDNLHRKETAVLFFTLESTIPDKRWKERIEKR